MMKASSCLVHIKLCAIDNTFVEDEVSSCRDDACLQPRSCDRDNVYPVCRTQFPALVDDCPCHVLPVCCVPTILRHKRKRYPVNEIAFRSQAVSAITFFHRNRKYYLPSRNVFSLNGTTFLHHMNKEVTVYYRHKKFNLVSNSHVLLSHSVPIIPSRVTLHETHVSRSTSVFSQPYNAQCWGETHSGFIGHVNGCDMLKKIT